MKNIGLACIFIYICTYKFTMSWLAALPKRKVIDNRDIKLWFIRNQMPFYIMKLDT